MLDAYCNINGRTINKTYYLLEYWAPQTDLIFNSHTIQMAILEMNIVKTAIFSLVI